MPTITFLGQPVDPLLALLLLGLLGWLVSTAVGLWIAYYLMKAAIRDGIKESGLVNSWASIVAVQRARDAVRDEPDMRAE